MNDFPSGHPAQLILERLGIRQVHAAKALGIDPSTLSSKFSGRIRFTTEDAGALLLFLQKLGYVVSFQSLFPYTGPRVDIDRAAHESKSDSEYRNERSVRKALYYSGSPTK